MLTTTELKSRCRYLAESLWDNDVKCCMKKVVYFFLNIDYGLLTLPEVVKFFEKSELGTYFDRKDINWRDYPIENIIYQCKLSIDEDKQKYSQTVNSIYNFSWAVRDINKEDCKWDRQLIKQIEFQFILFKLTRTIYQKGGEAQLHRNYFLKMAGQTVENKQTKKTKKGKTYISSVYSYDKRTDDYKRVTGRTLTKGKLAHLLKILAEKKMIEYGSRVKGGRSYSFGKSNPFRHHKMINFDNFKEAFYLYG
jgi:hypothetical protein